MTKTIKLAKILLPLLLLAGLLAAVGLVKRTQETRKGAAYEGPQVSFLPLPDPESPKRVGDQFSVYLLADFGDKKVVGFTIKLRYSADKLSLTSDDIEINGAFDQEIFKQVNPDSGEIILSAAITASDGVQELNTIDNSWIKLNFEVIAEGQAEVRLDKDYPAHQILAETADGQGEDLDLKNPDGGDEIKVTYQLNALECEKDSGCDDNNPCTRNVCLEGECQFPPRNGIECGSNMTCWSGTCQCNNGYSDCNDNPDDGCEINTLNDKNNCGSCGVVCGDGEECQNGECVSVDQGCQNDSECDDNNPCTTDTCQPDGTCSHDNSPGASCGANARCDDDGTCLCNPNFADCDGNLANGCEVNLANDENNCSACGIVCGDGEECQNGTCVSLTPTEEPEAGTPILNFKVTFTGVLNAQAVKEIPEVVVKIKQGFDLIAEYTGIELEPDEGPVFKGQVFLDGVQPGDGYTIYIKGPKHLARKFCQDKQAERCFGEGQISLQLGENNFDFTQLSLEPGDVPNPSENMRQDGLVNGNDFSAVKLRLGQTAPEELKVADLDFNGTINTRDLILLLQTLSSKYGEEE